MTVAVLAVGIIASTVAAVSLALRNGRLTADLKDMRLRRDQLLEAVTIAEGELFSQRQRHKAMIEDRDSQIRLLHGKITQCTDPAIAGSIAIDAIRGMLPIKATDND